MKFLGMYRIPIVGEVGPDGVVEFDPMLTKFGKVKRFAICRKCKRRFETDENQDYWTTCDNCCPR